MGMLTRSTGRTFSVGLAILWASYLTFLIWGYYAEQAGVRRHHMESGWLIQVALLMGALVIASREEGFASAHAATAFRVSAREIVSTVVTCLAVAFALFGRTLFDGLLSDDFVLADRVRRQHLFVDTGTDFFRPLPLLLWSGIAAYSSVPAVWLHALNVGLHGINGALVAFVARRWTFSRPLAMGAAILFLIFPGHVEAIAWISGMQDVLMVTGALTFVLAISAGRQTWCTRSVALVALVAALLSKETGVAIIGLGALTLVQQRGTSTSRHWTWWGVTAAVAIVFLVWRITAVPQATAILPSFTAFGLKDFVAKPLAALGSPWSTTDLDEGAYIGALGAWCALAIALRAVVGTAQPARHGLIAIGALSWIVIAVAPVGRYFFVAPDLLGGRYLYLPCVGWSILLVGLTGAGVRSGERTNAITSLLPILILGALYGWGTARHLAPWRAAGDERDRLLSEIREQAARESCPRVAVDRIPHTIDGAYVFLNGLPEAVAVDSDFRVRVELQATDVPPQCHVRPARP
jgi:hypothetical protein